MKKHKVSLTELYCQNCQSRHTATNAHYRLMSFADWLKSEYRVTDLEKVKVEHILSYKGHLAKSGLAPVSQARYLETIRSFFRWCVQSGLLDRDPGASVKSPRATLNKEPQYLSTNETRKLFDAIDPNGKHGARDLAMAWALALGLRVGEVVSLDVQDLITPNDDKTLPGLRIHGKRSYERIVPLSGAAYSAMLDYLSTRQAAPQDAPLFVCHYAGESERRLTTRAVQKWFGGLVTSAGLPKSKGHCHSMRHGFATRLLFEGNTPGSVYTVSRYS